MQRSTNDDGVLPTSSQPVQREKDDLEGGNAKGILHIYLNGICPRLPQMSHGWQEWQSLNAESWTSRPRPNNSRCCRPFTTSLSEHGLATNQVEPERKTCRFQLRQTDYKPLSSIKRTTLISSNF